MKDDIKFQVCVSEEFQRAIEVLSGCGIDVDRACELLDFYKRRKNKIYDYLNYATFHDVDILPEKWAEHHASLNTTVPLDPEIPERLRLAGKIVPKEKLNAKQSSETFVYLMKCERTGYHKIGRSIRPEFREKTLQAQIPTVTLVRQYMSVNNDEEVLHKMFSNKRIRGEWFNLSEEDIEAIGIYFLFKSR